MHDVGATLPLAKLPFTVADGELVPHWLGDRDRPWLRDLLAAAEAFAGRPVAALTRAWRRGEPDPRAGQRFGAAVHVLERWLRRGAAAVPRGALRLELFRRVAAGATRDGALAAVAARHGLAASELVATLYGDLPDQRHVVWPEPALDPSRLAAATNNALVRGLLRHAVAAELDVHGASRVLLKTAWLLGAAPRIEPAADTATLVWGERAPVLAALVPLLPWARRYRLRATCVLPATRSRDGHTPRGALVLATGDPLLPGPEPRPFDSALERRCARELAALLPDWDIVREPTAVVLTGGLAFPDFELRPRGGGAPWLCEITGLRDGAALPGKLELLTRCPNLVLCLPERAVPAALRGHPRIVTFRRRLDARAVAAVVTR